MHDRVLLLNEGMESAQATRAAVAGVAMAFLSIVTLSVGRHLFGWSGVVAALILIMLIARGLHSVVVRWIRGTGL